MTNFDSVRKQSWYVKRFIVTEIGITILVILTSKLETTPAAI
jgi:hypothetical protein